MSGVYCTADTEDEGAGSWTCLVEMVEHADHFVCPKCGHVSAKAEADYS